MRKPETIYVSGFLICYWKKRRLNIDLRVKQLEKEIDRNVRVKEMKMQFSVNSFSQLVAELIGKYAFGSVLGEKKETACKNFSK